MINPVLQLTNAEKMPMLGWAYNKNKLDEANVETAQEELFLTEVFMSCSDVFTLLAYRQVHRNYIVLGIFTVCGETPWNLLLHFVFGTGQFLQFFIQLWVYNNQCLGYLALNQLNKKNIYWSSVPQTLVFKVSCIFNKKEKKKTSCI